MRFDELDLTSIPAASKQVFYPDVCQLTGGDALRLAVLVTRGARPGPTIAVFGGVHGDEYEGPHAVRTVYADLDPADLAGTFVGIPECNPPAFATASRTSPIDGLNLARVCPGNPNGTPTERIAHCISEYVIRRSDFLIDLHSSGTRWTMALLVGYDGRDTPAGRASRAAAFAFGAPIVWGHPELGPGRTVTVAAAHEIPWLYTECPGGGWLDHSAAALYARGVTNVMKHLGMLDESTSGAIVREPNPRHLFGEGRIENSLTSKAAGFLLSEVRLLDRVKRGDLLGRVLGQAGEVLEEIRAETDGFVIFYRANPSIFAGDLAFLLTDAAD